MPKNGISAVLWDFGGVILSSPFEAFNEYEEARGIPRDLIRTVNAANPDANAWALLERSEITHDQFNDMFAEESAALGHRIPGADVLALLHGSVRPDMVDLLDRVIAEGYRTACLTNNVVPHNENPSGDREKQILDILKRFDEVVQSSKVGVRKPEPRFYEIACEMLNVTPKECVFLDDLGINLKPAAAMGMTTIKVTGSAQAIADLSKILDL
jgi:putative hydrolase of the HAD superfamily